jgi:aspartate/methionine/tyrosine aminotransferase
MPERAGQIGMSVREADRWLNLDGGGRGLLDTTHFDTVRFPPPAWAAGVIGEAVASGELAYTPYRGHPGVLDTLAATLGGVLGVPLSPAENLALTPGTQASLFATLSALVDEGDGAPRLDLAALGQACEQRPKLLLFTNPSNPLGIAYDAGTIDVIAELAERWDFRVVVDSLYCRLVYEEAPFQHLIARPGMRDRCVTLLGPSKTESMSGYRVGVTVAPADVLEAIEPVLAAMSLRAPAYAQQLLSRWWTDDLQFVAERIADLRALRELSLNMLRQVPYLRAHSPQATAYLFPDVSALGLPDQEVAARLQQDAKVVVSPGYQFGPAGVGHFRVCFARDEAQWEEALGRIVAVLNALGKERGVA